MKKTTKKKKHSANTQKQQNDKPAKPGKPSEKMQQDAPARSDKPGQTKNIKDNSPTADGKTQVIMVIVIIVIAAAIIGGIIFLLVKGTDGGGLFGSKTKGNSGSESGTTALANGDSAADGDDTAVTDEEGFNISEVRSELEKQHDDLIKAPEEPILIDDSAVQPKAQEIATAFQEEPAVLDENQSYRRTEEDFVYYEKDKDAWEDDVVMVIETTDVHEVNGEKYCTVINYYCYYSEEAYQAAKQFYTNEEDTRYYDDRLCFAMIVPEVPYDTAVKNATLGTMLD